MMDHPSMAKVFDAGTTPDGQPYFVMEYVRDVPLTDYCNEKKLRIRDRLQLFVQVCEAVQHAHRKTIIHRDLKPGNILVTEVDGKPVPRIIDFGLAKATSTSFAADVMATRAGVFLGTPGYMSPEQTISVLGAGKSPQESGLFRMKAPVSVRRGLSRSACPGRFPRSPRELQILSVARPRNHLHLL